MTSCMSRKHFYIVALCICFLGVQLGIEKAENDYSVEVGRTKLTVPESSIMSDYYFGSQISNSTLDTASMINLKIPLFEEEKPTAVTVFEYSSVEQIYHPEAADAYYGIGKYAEREVEFDKKNNMWLVFPNVDQKREWMLFSSDPSNRKSTFEKSWVAYCYNASAVIYPDRFVCMAWVKSSTLGGQFNFDFEKLNYLEEAKTKLKSVLFSYINR